MKYTVLLMGLLMFMPLMAQEEMMVDGTDATIIDFNIKQQVAVTSIQVDGSVACSLNEGVLTCTSRQAAAPAPAEEPEPAEDTGGEEEAE